MLATLFDEETVGKWGDTPPVVGLGAIEASIRKYLGGCGPSQHLMGFVDLEETADGYESRCLARVYHQGAGDRAMLTQETFGEYRVRWVRRADGWRAAEWRFDVHFTTGSWDVFQPG